MRTLSLLLLGCRALNKTSPPFLIGIESMEPPPILLWRPGRGITQQGQAKTQRSGKLQDRRPQAGADPLQESIKQGKKRPPPIEVQASKKYSRHPQGKVSKRQGKVEHMSSKEKLKQHNEK